MRFPLRTSKGLRPAWWLSSGIILARWAPSSSSPTKTWRACWRTKRWRATTQRASGPTRKPSATRSRTSGSVGTRPARVISSTFSGCFSCWKPWRRTTLFRYCCCRWRIEWWRRFSGSNRWSRGSRPFSRRFGRISRCGATIELRSWRLRYWSRLSLTQKSETERCDCTYV